MQVITIPLSTGTITVRSAQLAPKLETLFAFAERRNPKRAFLFVSKILGKHIPISPSIMRDSYQFLANKLPNNLPTPIVFIGMAETAVGLGSGVFEEGLKSYPDALFIMTTRHLIPEKTIFCEFKEEHSHATDHIVYEPSDEADLTDLLNAKTLVLIDDEATTGKTFLNLYNGLHVAGIKNIERLVTVTLTDWSNHALTHVLPLKIDEISLITGQWEWHSAANAPTIEMPSHTAKQKNGVIIASNPNFGRFAIRARPNIALHLNRFLADSGLDQFSHLQKPLSMLVLGTSEFSYLPFLLAEKLENMGHLVKFSATTRSPIAHGLAIESSLQFDDNYGEGITHYCYNVAHQKFDWVILCVETPAASVDVNLIDNLNKITPRVSIFSLFPETAK